MQLVWNPNTEPALAGYKLYQGTEPRKYTTSTDVGKTTTFKVTGLQRGIHYFAVTAYDFSRVESDYSNEVRVAIDPPGQPFPAPAVRTVGNAATIAWETVRPSAVRIDYGPTVAYGSSVSSGSVFTLKHTLGLTGLAPATTYHYRTVCRDDAGNVTITGDMVFTTPADATAPIAATFYYPRTVGPSENRMYTGVAFVNLDSGPALLTFRPWAGAGTLSPGIRILNAGEQIAVLDVEILGESTAVQESAGWVEVNSTTARMFGFFMSFDHALSSLEGSTLLRSPVTGLLFPSLVAERMPQLMLANPRETPAGVTLEFLGTNGTVLRSVSLGIGAAAAVSVPSPVVFSHVRATSDTPVVGFQVLERPGDWKAFLPAQSFGSGATVLWGLQYVHGDFWHSHVTLVNTGPTADTVSLRWVADDGTQIGQARSLSIPANGGAVVADPGEFGVGGDTIRQGYIEIRSAVARIAGSVTIHDEAAGRFATALPLISQPASLLVVPHVASDGTYFTGLAVANPSDADTRFTVELRGADGNLRSSVSETLAARKRKARLVTELFPELSSQSVLSGYLRIVADRPVVAFAVFGTHDLSLFSAIPAQAVQ
ncbi:MAG: hypothetical protein HXY20_06280 [Acidobacteria bacterium]|nr:hypothetical protein [Acidobacteriota bacterium]